MHDGHPHASCGDCVSFVAVFPDIPGLHDWGYCREQQPNLPAQQLAELRQACLAGDRRALRANTAGIYRTEEDDCCDFFRHRDW
ncbi:MAG: hypothetical protein Kow0010_04890 [Dehalococcoidia bacterium]